MYIPQEQLPDGGITCTYALMQKNAVQQTFLGSKTQQPVETYLGPRYPEQISKDREIQNGNTGYYKDLPSARGMGNIH